MSSTPLVLSFAWSLIINFKSLSSQTTTTPPICLLDSRSCWCINDQFECDNDVHCEWNQLTEECVSSTNEPSTDPTSIPTPQPTPKPTLSPSSETSINPTTYPTPEPTPKPSLSPTTEPTALILPLPMICLNDIRPCYCNKNQVECDSAVDIDNRNH